MSSTPILFLVYNRPELTQRVLAAIRVAQPGKLFLAADGPKPGKPGDYEKCQAVRNILRDGIDWDCEVHTLLREDNLGCKIAVSSALTWFFENVEEGIILEDDTVPSPSFFPFCAELLEKYRDDERILHIGACNFQQGRMWGPGSYYFSIYTQVWGWATWRRAWKFYDVNMKSFPEVRKDDSWLAIFSRSAERDWWMNTLQMVWEGKIDTWDFQWTFAVWCNRGLGILPNVNLVNNIGCGSGATHTTDSRIWYSNLRTGELGALVHPSNVVVQHKADQFAFDHLFTNKPMSAFSSLGLVFNRLSRGFLKVIGKT